MRGRSRRCCRSNITAAGSPSGDWRSLFLWGAVWDWKLEPTPKVNLCASIIAGIVCGVLQFARSYRKYQALAGSAAAGVFMLVFTVAVCYAVVSFVAFLYRRRVERLESEEEEDEEDEQ